MFLTQVSGKPEDFSARKGSLVNRFDETWRLESNTFPPASIFPGIPLVSMGRSSIRPSDSIVNKRYLKGFLEAIVDWGGGENHPRAKNQKKIFLKFKFFLKFMLNYKQN